MSIAMLRASDANTHGIPSGGSDDPRHSHAPAITHDVTSIAERSDLRPAMAPILADEAVTRIAVVGGHGNPDAFLAAVLTRLLMAGRLDIELAYIAPNPTRATANYGLPTGSDALALAVAGQARDIPLIRDDTSAAIVGYARHLGAAGSDLVGETYVDDTRLFTGTERGVLIIPTATAPGIRARLDRRWRRRWHHGRAAQTGGIDILVERDGVGSPRPVQRSTFYRDRTDWKLVLP